MRSEQEKPISQSTARGLFIVRIYYLWTMAQAIPGIKEKVARQLEGIENPPVVVPVSYQKFSKMSVEEFDQYDFTVFDECHMLKNYSTRYTTRFMQLYYPKTSMRKFLAMSATPNPHSMLDFIYVIKACGAFPVYSPSDIKIKFFEGKPSFFNQHLIETGDFVNRDEFMMHVNHFIVRLTQKDLDPQFPGLSIEFYGVDVNMEVPENIEEFTDYQRDLGLAKVDCIPVEESRKLVLTKYHETAKKLHKRYQDAQLDSILCLSATSRRKYADWMENNPHTKTTFITTLGLTQCDISLNTVDSVWLIDSTYAWLKDRQSIKRCLGFGKKNAITATYVIAPDEHPMKKTAERLELEFINENSTPKHSEFGPSRLNNLYYCPGAYWINDVKPNLQWDWHGFRGHNMHYQLQYYLTHLTAPVPSYFANKDVITFLRRVIPNADLYGVEDKISCPEIREDFFGTCDFWAYNKESGELVVVDYKTGSSVKNAKSNWQLWAYTIMLLDKVPEPTRVRHIIIKDKKMFVECYLPSAISRWYNKIKKLSDTVDKAKEMPYNYISDGKKCTPFCKMHNYHEEQRLKRLKQQEEKCHHNL